jgi:hypothetical protein
MDRLSFTLPDFTRYAWVIDQARETWEPRLTRITTAFREIEWRAVVAGVRRCAIAMAAPEEFLDLGPRWAAAGLTAVPVEIAGASGQPYSATSVPLRSGEPFAFRFAVGRPDDTVAFVAAWEQANQEAIGDLLGYPACCREFFRRVWVDDEMVDTTWPMARNSLSANGETALDVAGPPQANILWRWMGVRAVPHLPCRFDCAATVAFADELVAVGRELGYGDEMDWMTEVLSWSVEWSALHGIAEVVTPILKVSTRTDATARKYTVRRRGDRNPAEALSGLRFPFEVPVTLRLSASKGYRQGLAHAATSVGGDPPWYATDNGFPSTAAMEAAHRPIVDLAAAALGEPGGDVLDLGCGNGALLATIAARVPGVRSHGIDSDRERIEHARVLNAARADAFVAGDLVDDERLWPAGRRYALAILMPGRLVEAGPERAAVLLARLRERCDRVLAYAYGDWCERPGGFPALLAETGLHTRSDVSSCAALVAVAPEMEVAT